MTKVIDMDLETIVKEVLLREISPFLKLHGGDCSFINIDEENIVHLKFEMACTACKLRPLTYLAAIRPRMMKIPGIKDVNIQGVKVSDFAKARSEKITIL
jgi:Fe-S cluster biogenesis protein NfuA